MLHLTIRVYSGSVVMLAEKMYAIAIFIHVRTVRYLKAS